MDSTKVITTNSISDEAWVANSAEALPRHFHESALQGVLPPELLCLRVRVGMRRWPDDHERHLEAHLGASLLELMRKGGVKLGIPSCLPVPTLNRSTLSAFLRGAVNGASQSVICVNRSGSQLFTATAATLALSSNSSSRSTPNGASY